MLGVTGAVGAFMEMLAEAAVESGLEIAAQAALGLSVAAGAYVIGKKIRKKRQIAGDQTEG